MSGRRFALLAALAIAVMFIASNLIANIALRGARLDLTLNHLYSLAPGTRFVLSPQQLAEPVELRFFYARAAAQRDPETVAYASRVRELLQSYAAAAHGRIRLVEVDPSPFSEEEDRAVEAGIQPMRAQGEGDPFYFGLAGSNAIDDRRAIPYFDTAAEPFLEYHITRLIYELENPEPPTVALITSLPIDPTAAAATQGQAAGPQAAFASELGRFMRVVRLPADFTEIPANARVLAIIHPPVLTPAQSYAIDQFVLRRGRAFVAVDPAYMSADASSSSPFGPAPAGPATSSSLPGLFTAWGVSMTPEVVLDGEASLPVNTTTPEGQQVQAPQPLFFRVDPDRMSRDDLMTAPLTRGLTFGLAGGLSASERPDRTARVLAHTTNQTMRITAEQALARPTPFDLMNIWQPTSREEAVALRLSGTLTTAFPNGPPEGALAATPSAPRLTRSATPAEIVIVSDVDMLSDFFYVDPQRNGTFADNGAFAINAIDILGGSQALVSLRARAPSLRRMQVVERMEADAQRSIEQRRQELQGELTQTEQRLQQLRARGQRSGFFTGDLGAELSRQARTEIERFTRRVTQVRAELRSVGRELRAGIDRLKAIVVFINVWLAPLLVAGAGLYLFWRRQSRAGRPQ